MRKMPTPRERAARVELLRARAAIERHDLARGVRRLRVSLSPKSLFKEALPVFIARGKPVDWLLQGVGLVRRYPFLLSGASAIISGRRARWIKLAAGVLVGWKLSHSLGRAAKESRES